MLNQKVVDNFKKHVPFTNDQLEVFFELAERKVIEKNKFLTKAGEENVKFYLIETGCLMAYITDETDQKHIMQFGSDLWWTGDLEAIMNNKESSWSIKAVERSTVYELSFENYELLLNSNVLYERYFRILFQNSLISHQKRIIRNISYSAEKRYVAFINQFARIELKVAQKYIASYLGVTPEFLSKLKKQMAQRELS